MMTEMIATGVEVEQAVENAVTWIVCTAVTKLSDFWQCGYNRGRFKSSYTGRAYINIEQAKQHFFHKSEKGSTPSCILQHPEKSTPRDIMFLHAILYKRVWNHLLPFGLGKKIKIKSYKNLRNYNKIAATFNSAFKPLPPRFAGERFKIEMSGGSSNMDTLNDFRYHKFRYSVIDFQMAKLPPAT